MEKVETLVGQAKMAELAERYDNMVKYMKEVVELHHKLSPEERNLLSVAYKNVVGARRSAWRILKPKVDTPSNKAVALPLFEEVTTELKGFCNEVISLLDNILISSAQTSEDSEATVFYQKMNGDYYRYLAEISTGGENKDMVDKAKEGYTAAHDLAKEKMPPTHPIRLGVALNFSVFYYEVAAEPDKACELAKQAFDDAIAELDQLKEDSYKDSTLIMQLLRDNLTLWTATSEKDEDQEEN